MLYSILGFQIAIIALSAFFGTVTVGEQVVVIKDFGLFSISLSAIAFAVISGSALLHKELARKTIYNILSKPVPRWSFVLGKYIGMLVTVAVIVVLMSIGLTGFLYCFTGTIDLTIFLAALHIVLELSIICAAAIFFSTIVVTPLLSGLFTFGVFLAGRSVEQLQFFMGSGSGDFNRVFLKILMVVLPNLHLITTDVFSLLKPGGHSVHLIYSVVYAGTYSGILLILATMLFQRRDFN